LMKAVKPVVSGLIGGVIGAGIGWNNELDHALTEQQHQARQMRGGRRAD
jgi:hypothetical protein